MKRIFDFCLAVAGIVVSAPLWLFLGLFILLEDGWPIFFGQDRVGLNGKIFKGLKFRSMSSHAEKNLGPVQSSGQDDPRVTRLGKIMRATAMDELPQLWNIAIGDMSFVGPRALRPVEIDVHDNQPRAVWDFPGFNERSRVRPGLTGVAQVLADRDIPRSEKFKYDIWYVQQGNFLLDMQLIILSFLITFGGRWEKRGEKLSRFFLKKAQNIL